MYIDGNVHGNEVQATETVLYSIWYLTKSYGEVDQLTDLGDARAIDLLAPAWAPGEVLLAAIVGLIADDSN